MEMVPRIIVGNRKCQKCNRLVGSLFFSAIWFPVIPIYRFCAKGEFFELRLPVIVQCKRRKHLWRYTWIYWS